MCIKAIPTGGGSFLACALLHFPLLCTAGWQQESQYSLTYNLKRCRKKLYSFSVAAWQQLSLAACSKSNDAAPDKEDPGTVSTGVYSIVNLAADTLATSAGDAKPLYYSLEQNKVVPESERYTTNWDICFTSIYNSSVYANNGKAKGTPGYGGPGNGAVYLVVDRTFDHSYGYDTSQISNPMCCPFR